MNTAVDQGACIRFPVAAALLALATCLPGGAAMAAETKLDDIPMAVANAVRSNVMFTLDDSGSMRWEVIPDPVHGNAYLTFPLPNGNGSAGTNLYGAVHYWYGVFDQTPTFDIASNYARCYRNASCNPLYYNPNIRYLPWSNADGSFMANASPSAAPFNPYNTGEGTFNLTVDQTYTRNWVENGGAVSSYGLTFYPATFFKYIGSGSAPTSVDDGANLSGNYEKVEIKSSSTYPKSAKRIDCAGTTCTYSEEIQNFANWFTYYRSRILAARAGVGRAFARQGSALRVGFGSINQGSNTVDGVASNTIIKGVREFNGTARSDWFSTYYGHTMPAAGTPLRRALADVGSYFSRTDDSGPWGEFPGVGGGTQYACRQNFSILMTDGYWNGDAAPSYINDYNIDNTTGSSLSTGTPLPPNMTAAQTYQYSPASPYSDSYTGTLADVAMYFWINDLRSDMANRVPPNTRDNAFWQHMSTFTVGFGVTGSISQTLINSAFSSPSTTAITWPDPNASDYNKTDDLAHAAINGRGGYYNAADPDTFADSLTDALNDVIGRNGAAAAAAVANPNLTAGDNGLYQTSYNSGNWTGDLVANPVNIDTGVVDASTSIWTGGSAGAQLTARTAPRYLATYSGSAGIRFQAASSSASSKLSAAQQTRLNTPSELDGADVVDYLRGVRTKETAGVYRTRGSLLGDIVNAEPLVVREPNYSYADDGYGSYKTSKASRTKVVVQGANDGMIHVFHAAATAQDAAGGSEDWAYIPKLLIDMNDPNNSGTSTLNILTRKSGFEHKYFADAPPVFGDVDFSKTKGVTGNPSPDWRTIVVGGLGKGGRGIYALDLTTTTVSGTTADAKETDAAAKVLWEFPNNSTSSSVKANIGFIYGNPIVAKTKAAGWVVMVASGYNNGSGTDSSGGTGRGYLFVLNAKTGELIETIDTGVGTATNPAGLSRIGGYAENARYDNTVTEVYGADLLGNVWRFNLTGNNSNSWDVAKLAVLKDAGSATQAVTTRPLVSRAIFNGATKRLVFVGTGKYLSSDDVTITQTQTMYALVDDLSATPLISDPVRNSLQVQTFSDSGSNRNASSATVDYATKRGWYIDLTKTGERIDVHPALALGVLAFVSNAPTTDKCLPGGSSYLNLVDFKNGSKLSYSVSSIFLGNMLSSRAVFARTSNGELKIYLRKSDGSTDPQPAKPGPVVGVAKRVSWREISK